MTDPARLEAAYEKARFDLLSERDRGGHWVGELSASALSTATAVSALTLVERNDPTDSTTGRFANEMRESLLSELIVGGLHWLADHQNVDGGWGDTDKSHSNIATTMLVVAAFRLTGFPAGHADLMERAELYIEQAGGVKGVRKRYGADKTFAAPILANCALAGIVSWQDVAPLPFELACLPQRFYRFARLPVVSYAIPALVAIGQVRYFHKKPLNPIVRLIRRWAVEPSLKVLAQMQPDGGGYLEAVPLTSFVVMSLAATGRARHTVTQRGLEFLVESVRADGSWPIDADLAVWNTTLAMNALAAGGEDLPETLDLGGDGPRSLRDSAIFPSGSAARGAAEAMRLKAASARRERRPSDPSCLDWLLDCQHDKVHPFTGAAPGGWGWSDLSGAVPDADDTPGALLALAAWRDAPSCRDEDRERIRPAAAQGAGWLLGLQNDDGGWPTFCRGWGKLPFDRSGADLTAHAIRSLAAWRDGFSGGEQEPLPNEGKSVTAAAVDGATERGFRFLQKQQDADGCWRPLWFGNQDHPREDNPVYGTAKVLLAFAELGRGGTEEARRGLHWLAANQNKDGGWGGGPRRGERDGRLFSSVEETALAVDALCVLDEELSEAGRQAAARGVEWLVRGVEENRHHDCSPIGFYFARLWYYEKLYPLTFTVSALGRALRAPRLSLVRSTGATRLTNA